MTSLFKKERKKSRQTIKSQIDIVLFTKSLSYSVTLNKMSQTQRCHSLFDYRDVCKVCSNRYNFSNFLISFPHLRKLIFLIYPKFSFSLSLFPFFLGVCVSISSQPYANNMQEMLKFE